MRLGTVCAVGGRRRGQYGFDFGPPTPSGWPTDADLRLMAGTWRGLLAAASFMPKLFQDGLARRPPQRQPADLEKTGPKFDEAGMATLRQVQQTQCRRQGDATARSLTSSPPVFCRPQGGADGGAVTDGELRQLMPRGLSETPGARARGLGLRGGPLVFLPVGSVRARVRSAGTPGRLLPVPRWCWRGLMASGRSGAGWAGHPDTHKMGGDDPAALGGATAGRLSEAVAVERASSCRRCSPGLARLLRQAVPEEGRSTSHRGQQWRLGRCRRRWRGAAGRGRVEGRAYVRRQRR
jgi:hypothetical protein